MTLTREEKRIFRKLLFKHQDGLAITANIVALYKNGIFDFLNAKPNSTLQEIVSAFPPKIVSLNLGNTPCTAYDVTHGFSDQYIVEVEVFNNAVKKAGLKINKEHYYKFPNSELSTVSINLIS